MGKYEMETKDRMGESEGGGGGGGYLRNFWVGMCCWDPETLNLYQS